MTSLTSLPKDVIGRILEYLPMRSAFSLLLTCQELKDCVLKTMLAPWKNNCKGLVHALEKGHIEYFQMWVEKAGNRWDLTFVSIRSSTQCCGWERQG